ncbi:MAG TPA: LuxR C-terminal-related transcriptional regulator [Acidimicrobiales bacterium]|nr:LuxR C-terminal-related transcriptional regulator [Acidimicrobiales bacterium]
MARERLVTLLDPPPQRSVTVVVAPAGYGKTVLLSQWAAARSGARVAWLTAEPEDNEPGRFATRLSQVLAPSGAAPDLATGSPRAVDRYTAGGRFAGHLLAALRGSQPATVVIDDAHVLCDPVLLDELRTLVEHLPSWVHILVGTRVDPSFVRYRDRVSGRAADLRQDDLAFNRDEAGELVRRLLDRDLTTAQLDALLNRTQGWIVGLQLAAVSLRDRAEVGHFIDTFADDDRHVADYLTEKVLRHQPPEIRRFLLATCILDRLSGPLCDAVTGENGGEAMLARLERASLFVTRPDSGSERRSYHPLFRTLLRHHLHDEDPAGEERYLRRAATWHLERDDLHGVDYLVEAGAWGEVIDAAVALGGPLFVAGRAARMTRLLGGVPQPVRRHRPDLLLHLAAVAMIDGDQAIAEQHLVDIGAIPSATPADRVVADLLRARLALVTGDAATSITAAGRALRDVERLDESTMPDVLGLTGCRDDLIAGALLTRGLALGYQGRAAARASLEASLGVGHPLWRTCALGALGLLDAWSGRLDAAEERAARALSLARELRLAERAVTADAHLALACVARARGELGEAARHLKDADLRDHLRATRVSRVLVAIERVHLALAADGVPLDPLALLADLRASAVGPLPHVLDGGRRSAEARLLIAIGDIDGAAHAIEDAPEDLVDVAVTRVGLALRRGDVVGARGVVERWPARPAPRAQLERRLWVAIIDDQCGDDGSAVAGFAEAVALAEPDRNLGVFQAAAAHIRGPALALYRTAPTPFVRSIADLSAGHAARLPTSVPGLVEHLTERELLVLAYLPSPLSNAEIAQRLDVSVNTVKTHLKHIYRKFLVTGRREAVAAAEQLRLV